MRLYHPKMRRTVPWTLVSLLGFLLLTQFTNCDVYSDRGGLLVNDFNSEEECQGDRCDSVKADMLELATVTKVYVLTSQLGIDLGGDCNEAGFPSHTIVWELLRNGVVLRNCAQSTTCGQCVNGRFQLNVYMCLNGQSCLIPSSDMQVRVEIKGYNSDGVEFTNPLLGRKTVQIQTF